MTLQAVIRAVTMPGTILQIKQRATLSASHPLPIDQLRRVRQLCLTPHSGQNLGRPSSFTPQSTQTSAFAAMLAPQLGHAPTTDFSNSSVVT